MKRRRLLFSSLAAIALAAVGIATANAVSSAAKVKVLLATPAKEFKFQLPTPSAKAGKITFVASNKGKLDHELVVLKTNLPPGKLPIKGTKAVEKGRVGKLPPVKPGKTKTLTLTLKSGKYVLICNIAGHYAAGSRAGFKVG